MEQTDEADMFLRHPFFYTLLVDRMLKTIKSPTEKFIFVYVYILGCKQKEAADVLSIHETNVSRHIKNMRESLIGFTEGYEDTLAKCKDIRKNKI